ncbi:MAG TPA: DUF4199 domain-containing protein [Puia sp.]|nr:DUF4199 domain-containing protein [Puia sp.]
MKRNILVFGLVSGAILAAFILSIGIVSKIYHGHSDNAVVGYSAMVIAFSFIFVGIKNFRDKYNRGIVGFGQAFLVGLGISLIGSTLYVGSWLIEYYCFMPDFMDKYSAALIEKAQHSGLSPDALQRRLDSINSMARMYKNPVMVILFTYLEVLPVGIVISLIASLILKRKKPRTATVAVG